MLRCCKNCCKTTISRIVEFTRTRTRTRVRTYLLDVFDALDHVLFLDVFLDAVRVAEDGQVLVERALQQLRLDVSHVRPLPQHHQHVRRRLDEARVATDASHQPQQFLAHAHMLCLPRLSRVSSRRENKCTQFYYS